jgi:hypothetical protein
MKYATLFFLTLISTFAQSAEVAYWEGLEYDYSNATAYQVSIKDDNIQFGVIGLTSQLYSYGGGYYEIIPQNVGVSFKKFFTTERLNLGVGVSYWAEKSMIFTDKLNYQLIVKYNLRPNIELEFQHFGLSSITKSKTGLNKVAVYVTF